MKRLCKASALLLCVVMSLSPLTVAGDSEGKTVLTLEDAKSMALKDNTRYKIQQSYIEQKKEDHEDLADKYSGNASKGSSIVEKTLNYANSKLIVDNAYNAWQLEIFRKGDIKRESDYNVTMAYYDVMKTKYSLDDAKRAMELAKRDLEIANLRLELEMAIENELSQFENAYKSSKTKYESAFAELRNKMAVLSRETGIALDIDNDDIDMAIGIPDIFSIDPAKIREDYLKNNANFFSLNNSLITAKYYKYLIEDKYDYYKDNRAKMSDAIEDGFEDLKYTANRDYDNAKYQYDENVKELDLSLDAQYSGMNTLMETIENLKKSIADTQITVKNNQIRYDLAGLISEIDLEKSKSSLKDLENMLNTAVVNLNAQYLSLTQYSYIREK